MTSISVSNHSGSVSTSSPSMSNSTAASPSVTSSSPPCRLPPHLLIAGTVIVGRLA